MNKLTSFVTLDLVTIKPFFTIKNLLIYACVTVFLTVVSGNVATGISVGMMFAILFAGYPFAAGEKCNIDALYATLSVGRKTVVLGRYMFTFALNLCCVICAVALAAIALFAAWQFDFSVFGADMIIVIVSLAVLFAVIQLIQLPILFKFGYTKARFFTIVPFLAIMICYFVITGLVEETLGPLHIFSDIGYFVVSNELLVFALALVALCLMAFLSYRVSARVYERREF